MATRMTRGSRMATTAMKTRAGKTGSAGKKTRKAPSAAKTQRTGASVSSFLAGAAGGQRLADANALVEMMERATGEPAAMWGDAIVGCDTYTLRYADGRESDWPLVAFSPRRSAFVLYIGWRPHVDLLKAIGPHKTAGGCLHLKSLDGIDRPALQRLITAAGKTRKAASK